MFAKLLIKQTNGFAMQGLEQLDCAAMQGCERSVITYSSLISACEKSGEWRLALRFFEECLNDGCRPNVITFNSLITACAQGALMCMPHAMALPCALCTPPPVLAYGLARFCTTLMATLRRPVLQHLAHL